MSYADDYYVISCGCRAGHPTIADGTVRGKCDACGELMKTTKVRHSEDPRAHVSAAEAYLTAANCHDFAALPGALWKQVSPMVPPALHLKLAKAIASESTKEV